MAEFVPFAGFRELPQEEMLRRALEFREEMARRRTVREFSNRPVPRALIEDCLRVAGSAPSGANLQPWHFAVVSDPAIQRKIREAAEEEEREFYHSRAPQEWLDALAPLGTDEHKPFLEVAPWLIVIFVQRYGRLADGRQVKHYYPTESVGIATGMLIAALHRAGLASLTHTPSPMNFLNEICGRPETERPFLVLVAGYPSENARVPRIGRKPLEEIASFLGSGAGAQAGSHAGLHVGSPAASAPVSPDASEIAFDGPRIRLRALDADDADDGEALVRWLTSQEWPFHGRRRLDPEQVRRQAADGLYSGDEARTWWIDADGEPAAGLVRLFDLADPTALFDLRIRSDLRGRGIGTSALRGIADRCFAEIAEPRRLAGYTRADNIAMRRAFHRAGFAQEAYYRSSWPDEDGGWHDCVGYTVLREEWPPRGLADPAPKGEV